MKRSQAKLKLMQVPFDAGLKTAVVKITVTVSEN